MQQLVEANPVKGQIEGEMGEQIQNKIVEVRNEMDQSTDYMMQKVEELRNSSSNPGANYYWLVFVVMYGSIYFFQ